MIYEHPQFVGCAIEILKEDNDKEFQMIEREVLGECIQYDLQQLF